jgi:glycosyltransferase involved in cell wall biosynthesis
MRVLCLTKRFSHHTAASGYDRLAEYLGASAVKRPVLTSFLARSAEKLWNYRYGSSVFHSHYRLEDRLAEELIFWKTLGGHVDIVHALYGDEQVDLLLRRIKFLSARLVLSLHYPVEQVQQLFRAVPKATLARIGGVVAVGASDVPGLKAWFGEDKVLFVPHGIDIEAFTPDSTRESRPTARFLFVGLHLRDFETAHVAIDRCARNGVDAEFDIVLPPHKQAFFTGCANVRRHSDLSAKNSLGCIGRRPRCFFLW